MSNIFTNIMCKIEEIEFAKFCFGLDRRSSILLRRLGHHRSDHTTSFVTITNYMHGSNAVDIAGSATHADVTHKSQMTQKNKRISGCVGLRSVNQASTRSRCEPILTYRIPARILLRTREVTSSTSQTEKKQLVSASCT